MDNNSKIEINSNVNSNLFKSSIVVGNSANGILKTLFNTHNELLSAPDIPSAQNREFLQEKVLKRFTEIADTSSFSIIKLLALYYIGDYYSFSNNLQFIEKVTKTIQHSDSVSPYYLSLADQLEFSKYQLKQKPKKSNIWLILLGFIFITGLVIILYLIKRKPLVTNSDVNFKLINSLSIQEKKVLTLLKEGKSNKEISSELHIEVSTVKSHLNKIYSRLGVTSRKDLIQND